MITYWSSVKDPQGRRLSVSWRALFLRFERPLLAEDKLRLPGWAPTTFRGDRRALANVERVFAVGLDVEGPGSHFDAGVDLWTGYFAHVHSTHSHSPEAHRYRVVLPCSRPMTPAEYVRVRRWCVRRSEEAGQPCDRQTSDPSRLWFVPGAPAARLRHYVTVTHWHPSSLDVEAILALEPEPAPEVAPVASVVPMRAEPTVLERARAYVRNCRPAISGSFGGTQTLLVAARLVRGFLLDAETAYSLMSEWNQTCQPPWSERDLRRKIREAAKVAKIEPGEMRDRRRA